MNNKKFENSFRGIYFAKLELKKENASDSVPIFFYLSIKMKEEEFSTKLYDKRDRFNFSIVRLTYKYGNIPSKMFYSTISNASLRICKATFSYYSIISRVHKLKSCKKK